AKCSLCYPRSEVVMPTVCFFFQAEDGIRDFHVTGVQTCALPILIFVLFPKIYFRKFGFFVRTYARYFLAFALLSYGTAKLFGGQFSFPSLERLDQKIGESSP